MGNRLQSTSSTGPDTAVPTGPGSRIPVVVEAPDPISRAGAASELRRHPVIDLVEDGRPGPGTVALLVNDQLDDDLLTRMRKLVRSDGSRAVLVVGAIRESELLDVVECGVGAIVWRHEATAQRLVRAVVAASRGDGDLPGDLLGRLINRVGTLHRTSAGHSGAPVSGLTAREVDVLRLVSEGLDTGEIAGKLAYSERTVKNVLHGITTRLHLRNRAHAVAYALREGYI
ncbi:response regulator transcription factor [Streptomyces althioticus]|jgi:DNA-binding NarL/FixJ family response regulator|uniref:LuxR family transcriptional regulator n=1 Tax=Streptomyces griseorubens TaxID=66897 RepID=A0ABR4T0M1_9ACTN|nr:MULTISPECIES: LuxR C-terminal-related transcriptional regulator [Streptomyces]ALV50713.1 LuxR family transcriptional regulator [Streptomyces sp. 4F]MBM4829613.1 response regulator transcription factor [Actinospica acidiphila]MCC9687287.1 LuxR C-terminal-related transcriptional regulator [Streptomyces sp. MNU103]WTB93779.1 LuxR C-terminal-related transcriptional regulator [Streptomyces althioticus]KEG41018.1 LuxR family transcriptional regulator [Streptomyces griseorubens]